MYRHGWGETGQGFGEEGKSRIKSAYNPRGGTPIYELYRYVPL